MAVLPPAESIRFLSEAGRTLAESLDPEATLAAVARLVVPRLADWMAVHQVDADGRVRRLFLNHPDPEKSRLAEELERRYPIPRDTPMDSVQAVIRTGKPIFMPEVPPDLLERAAIDADHLDLIRAMDIRSSMVVPLAARGRSLGTLSLVLSDSGRRYDEEDLLLAGELAHRVALAVDNARLHAESQRQAAALEEREATLRLVLDNLVDFVTLFAVEGDGGYRIESTNRQLLMRTGRNEHEVVGRRLEEIIPEPLLTLYRGKLGKAVETRGSVEFEHAFSLIPGTAQTRVSPVTDGAGRVTHLLAVTRDLTPLRKAEGEVRATRDLLQTALDTLADTVTVQDASGRILFANEAQARALGFESLWEMQATPVERLPDQVEVFLEDGTPLPREQFASAQALKGKTIRQRIIRTRTRSTGEEKWYEVHATPVLDGEGKVVLAITGAHDITRIKRAEEALRSEEERLRLALDAGRIGTWEWDLAADRVIWSERIYAIHGMEPGSFGGRMEDFAALVHPDDLGRVQEAIAKAMAEKSTYEVEFRAVRPTGEIQWIYTSARFQLDAAGEPRRMLGVTVDITERHRAEEALRRGEEQYRLLTDHVPQLIWRSDPRGEALFYNRQWEEYTGRHLRPEQAVANRDLVHPEDLPRLLEARARGVAEGSAYSLEYRLRRRDGQYRWHLGKVVPLRDAEGRIESWFGTATDIHDLRSAQEENQATQEKLRQSQKVEAIGRLAGGIAHDFNNLLTAINGYSDLLLAQMPADHAHHAFVHEIKQAGERAASLTRQLLAYSRRQILNPKVTDLNGIVVGMSNLLRRLIGETIRLETFPEADLGKVRVDQGQIEQVILNLAINARDAMPEGGELAIRTRNRVLAAAQASFDSEIPPGAYVELELSDTGHGMDEAVLSRLFEPFFTTKEVGKGTGLGLSMVQGIVRQSGGYILVESAPGRGAAFRILLPAVQEAPPGQEPAGAKGVFRDDLKAAGEIVLLVEDEAPVRRYVREILERAGYRVLEAASGPEALALAREAPDGFQLLVSDVVMPGMMGPHLAAELRRLRGDLKVLFMSGYSELSILQHPELDEKTNFLQKPFPPQDLLRKAREVLAAGVP